jgi:hypothetical protein
VIFQISFFFYYLIKTFTIQKKIAAIDWTFQIRLTFPMINEETIAATLDPGAIVRIMVNKLQNIRRNVIDFMETNEENLLIKLRTSID